MSVFNIAKLNLKCNNIHNLDQGTTHLARSKYNSSILENIFLEDTEFVYGSFLEWKEVGEALILLKVWAGQRSSLYVHDCFNGFLISVILAYLVGRQQINNSITTIQIICVTLKFIGKNAI